MRRPEGGRRARAGSTRTNVPHIRSGVGRVEDDLLQRYVARRDLPAREELVARMRPIIRRLARRYRHSGYVEDLEQAAALGLTKALERFDPRFGTDLVRYAVPTMVGEMRRWLRDHSWAVRPPREAAETWLELVSATESMTAVLGHTPTTARWATSSASRTRPCGARSSARGSTSSRPGWTRSSATSCTSTSRATSHSARSPRAWGS